MTFEVIYNAAVDVANRMTLSGVQPTSDTTVCVIVSRGGRLYNGVSHMEMAGGAPVNVHAEVDAMRNMRNMGEVLVDTLIVINAVTRLAVLPCSGCVSFITSCAPENSNATVAMPDRMLRITEAARYGQGGYPGAPMQGIPVGNIQQGNIQQGAPVGNMGQGLPAQFTKQTSVRTSEYTKSQYTGNKAKGDLLKDRVSDIMNVAIEDDDDDEEFLEELSAPKKKKRFGLF
ncbi:MAG: cytidine deaminase [Ruminococcus sp.]|nr:cytidine deaminase [Ruminococcus sp.]